jgi:hypothetical protein
MKLMVHISEFTLFVIWMINFMGKALLLAKKRWSDNSILPLHIKFMRQLVLTHAKQSTQV